MKRELLIFVLILTAGSLFGQVDRNIPLNTAGRLLNASDSKLSIGGYAQIDFNQPVGDGVYHNGNLDVHRLVLMFGYKFDEKTRFITEIELEHVEEVYVEQAFLEHEILPWLNFRGGLMLIPMGIINEYHEPTTYNGVERPNVDSKIVPTTWRELGLGFTGVLPSAMLKYQVYVMNGFNGWDGSPHLSGKNGLRKGRQKGIESFVSSPNLAAKVDYFGIPGLKLGLSGYFGDTQSTAYDGVDKDDAIAKATADSSVVGVNMIGLDARYNTAGWEFRGQYNYASLSNTSNYNAFTGSDVGSALEGWYLEAGYNVFHTVASMPTELVPFVRYEHYDTHADVADGITRNDALNIKEITAGLGWRLTTGAVLKADYRWKKSKADDDYSGQFNLGIGVWF